MPSTSYNFIMRQILLMNPGPIGILQTPPGLMYFTNSSSGTISHPLNWDASVNFLYNNGTCTVTHGPSAAGPIHVLDSGTVAVDPINKEITVVFTKALIPSYYVPFPSWNYTCGSDQGTLGGGLGPPFPSYLQFGMMDIPGTEETIIITPQYKMVVTRE